MLPWTSLSLMMSPLAPRPLKPRKNRSSTSREYLSCSDAPFLSSSSMRSHCFGFTLASLLLVVVTQHCLVLLPWVKPYVVITVVGLASSGSSCPTFFQSLNVFKIRVLRKFITCTACINAVNGSDICERKRENFVCSIKKMVPCELKVADCELLGTCKRWEPDNETTKSSRNV